MELQVVPISSMIGMLCSLLVVFLLPIGLCMYAMKKWSVKLSSLLWGMATFIVAAMVLEQMFHGVVMSIVGVEKLTGNIWIYGLYGGLCAAVFEESARFIVLRRLVKKVRGLGDAFLYGVGHGGIEAILIVGLVQISNLSSSIMINNGKIMNVLNGLDGGTRETMIDQLSTLWTSQSYLFYISGIERILAISGHICFSIFIYLGIVKQKKALLLAAYIGHMLFNMVTVVMNSYFGVIVAEVTLFFMVSIYIIILKMNIRNTDV